MLRRRRRRRPTAAAAAHGTGSVLPRAPSTVHAARAASTMPPNDSSGVVGALRAHWRAALAELLATALLVALGVAACLPALGPDAGAAPALRAPPLAHPALAFGLVVLANVEVFGPVSGAHMNPSVTLAAVLAGRMGPGLAAAYAAAQLAGAALGFGALLALAPAGLAEAAPAMGATLPARGVSAAAAAAAEAALTGLLALLCCALWAAPPAAPRDTAAPLKLGLTVAGLVYAGGELTGASLNPARSLAPALFMNQWRDHWVYWVGPLGGAALGALLHRLVLAPPRPRSAGPPPPAADELPLNDKAVC